MVPGLKDVVLEERLRTGFLLHGGKVAKETSCCFLLPQGRV